MKKLLLTTALSLSLISSGVAFSADTSVTGSKPTHHYETGMGHGKLLASLPKDKADLFKSTMKQVHEKNKPLYEQVKSLHNDLSAITKAATFDDKAYTAKSTEIANVENNIHANKTEALASFLSKLTQDERSKFADSMGKKHKHDKFGKKSETSKTVPTPTTK